MRKFSGNFPFLPQWLVRKRKGNLYRVSVSFPATGHFPQQKSSPPTTRFFPSNTPSDHTRLYGRGVPHPDHSKPRHGLASPGTPPT